MSEPVSGQSSSSHLRGDQQAILDGGKSIHSLEGNWRDYFPEIIGNSPVLLRVLETVVKVSRSDSAVLISGPSGTGKELIASSIHRLSGRSSKRFMAINCSAIPEDLLESELFGHERGAFTSADRRRVGLFEVAEGGTIFLDEIGDMSLRLQAKLLRVLQERKFTPVGSNEVKRSDVRIIAATNIDLQKAVENGRFRLDLFYRLNVVPVTLAALRERSDDIPMLLRHFLEIANRLHSISSPCYFDEDALMILSQHTWPGNVRELQNLVERMVILTGGGRISPQHLPTECLVSESTQAPAVSTSQASNALRGATVAPTNRYHPAILSSNGPGTGGALSQPQMAYPSDFSQLPTEGIDLPSFIENLENSLIRQALDRTQNNKNQAARLLGLNRTTLVERIKKRKLGFLNDPNDDF